MPPPPLQSRPARESDAVVVQRSQSSFVVVVWAPGQERRAAERAASLGLDDRDNRQVGIV